MGSTQPTYARCRPLAEVICEVCARPSEASDADAQILATVLRSALGRLQPVEVRAPDRR